MKTECRQEEERSCAVLFPQDGECVGQLEGLGRRIPLPLVMCVGIIVLLEHPTAPKGQSADDMRFS